MVEDGQATDEETPEQGYTISSLCDSDAGFDDLVERNIPTNTITF